MKVTNKQLYQYYNELRQIASKVSGILAYKVSYNMQKITTELQMYSEKRDSFVYEYGTTTESGEPAIEIGTEAYQKFVDAMKPYDNIEVSVDILYATMDDFKDSTLNANEILPLQFMVE